MMDELPFVAMIAKDSIRPECIMSLAKAGLLEDLRINIEYGHDRARNLLMNEFLVSGKRYILWVDSDNTVPVNILDILKTDKPFVAPLNYTWRHTADGQIALLPGVVSILGKRYTSWRMADLHRAYKGGQTWIKCDFPAGGVYALRRDIVEKSKDDRGMWFRQTFELDGMTMHGEDSYLFRRLHDLGIECIVYIRVEAGHVKPVNLAEVSHKALD
jgi:hypothetical protein